MKNKVALVGILAIVFAIFAVSSAAAIPIPPGKDAVVWFDPDPSSGPYGDDVYVDLWVNTSVYLVSWADWIYFDPSCVDITAADFTGTPFTEGSGMTHWGDYIRIFGSDPDFCEETTGEIFLAKLTLQCNCTSACISELYHHPDHLEMFECDFAPVPTEWVHGTFKCMGPEESVNIDFVEGWNLASLCFEPSDNSPSEVLSSVWDNVTTVKEWDATSHNWIEAPTMDRGTGYFVLVTQDCTWNHTGQNFTGSMDIPLKTGLNLVGYPFNKVNTTSDALSGLDYYYAAPFNASTQKYEDTYNPVAPDPFNRFTTINPCEGFWISAKSDQTWTAA